MSGYDPTVSPPAPTPTGKGIPLIPGMRYAMGVKMTDQQAMLLRQGMSAGRACVYPRGRAPFQPEPPSDHTHVVTYTEQYSGEIFAPGEWNIFPEIRWLIPYPTAYDAQQCASGALLPSGVNQGFGIADGDRTAAEYRRPLGAAVGAVAGAGTGFWWGDSPGAAAVGGITGAVVGYLGGAFLGAIVGGLAGWIGGKVERAR